jgi:hypothetical protein
MDKRKSLILASAVVLIAILSVALLSMQNTTPTNEEDDNVIPENAEETSGLPYGGHSANFTFPEGDFNFTIPEGGFNSTFPEGGFNFTFPENGFNSTFPDGGFNFTQPGDGFQNRAPPFMGNLTDEQRTILNEKMQELRESGATPQEIMAAMQELMEEFGVQNP